MKKLSILLVVVMVMSLFLTACGEKAPEPTQQVNTGDVTQNVVNSPDPTEEVTPAETSTPFDTFKGELSKSGFTYETVTMGAELVGAVKGEKYKFDFGSVELYEFEDGSEALSAAKENVGLTLEGFGTFPCEFNGNLAMLIDVTENEDTIKDIFNGL